MKRMSTVNKIATSKQTRGNLCKSIIENLIDPTQALLEKSIKLKHDHPEKYKVIEPMIKNFLTGNKENIHIIENFLVDDITYNGKVASIEDIGKEWEQEFTTNKNVTIIHMRDNVFDSIRKNPLSDKNFMYAIASEINNLTNDPIGYKKISPYSQEEIEFYYKDKLIRLKITNIIQRIGKKQTGKTGKTREGYTALLEELETSGYIDTRGGEKQIKKLERTEDKISDNKRKKKIGTTARQKEEISQEEISQNIYRLCQQITIQQSYIFDILKARFPDMYLKNREIFVSNRRRLSSSTKKMKKNRQGIGPNKIPIKIRTSTDEIPQDRLQKKIQDPELLNKLCYHLRSFATSVDEIKDIAQDAIIKAYEKRHEYDETKGEPITRIYKIARHVAIDHNIKTKKNRQKTYNPNHNITQEDRLDHLAAKGNKSTTDTIDDESRKIFLEKINKLIKGKLTAYEIDLVLSLAEGEKYKQIAERLEKPIGSIKAQVFRARKKMKPYLGDFKKILEN